MEMEMKMKKQFHCKVKRRVTSKGVLSLYCLVGDFVEQANKLEEKKNIYVGAGSSTSTGKISQIAATHTPRSPFPRAILSSILSSC